MREEKEETTNVGRDDDDDDDDNIWGSNEGYTPLAAWAQAGGGNGLFSMGPTNDDDDSNDGANTDFGGRRGGNGTFFANLQAFTVAAAAHSSDDDDGNGNDTNYQNVGLNVPRDNAKDSTDDDNFISLADQALLALEDDYRMTLQGEKSCFPSFPSRDSNTTEQSQPPPNAAADLVETEALPPSFAAEFDAARQGVVAPPVLSTTDETMFAADFSHVSRQIPAIDTDKVRAAVQNLQIRRPQFQNDLVQWEREQQKLAAVAPLHHPLIPGTICRTFRNRKARAQTQALSRAATLAHALHRLNVLHFQVDHPLVIHILGCDHVEGASREQLTTTFGPLVTWMQQHARKAPRKMELHLVGPNLPALSDSVIELVPKKQQPQGKESRLESVQLACHDGLYHEWRERNPAAKVPDLLITYHPGFWGYDSWKPTLQWLNDRADKIALVATSYTLLEAEEDQQVLETTLSNATKLWESEYNPFASQQVRPTATAVQGEAYHENSAWQAWRI